MAQLATRNGTAPHATPTRDIAAGGRAAGGPGTEPPRRFALGEADIRALHAVQRAADRPALLAAARGMSLFGEHAAGWLALGALGAATDRGRRREWVTATAGVALAHAASVGVKRVVRRARPEDPRVRVLVGTPSRLSFPSAHATSTAAAALLFGRLLRRAPAAAVRPPAVVPVAVASLAVVPMALSRLVLGVHYPSDVVAGSVLGAAVAAVVTVARPPVAGRAGRTRP